MEEKGCVGNGGIPSRLDAIWYLYGAFLDLEQSA
jgi:hypothetical protein